MTAKKKKREIPKDMMESAHKIWLAGLGAMAVAEEEGSKLFKNLVDRGHDIEDRGKQQVERAKDSFGGVRTVAESYWETFERKTLTKKVEDLTKSVEKLRTNGTAKPRPRTTKATASRAKTTKTTRK
jgi:polyhydroxyalkanoate synthesis regulator phasin